MNTQIANGSLAKIKMSIPLAKWIAFSPIHRGRYVNFIIHLYLPV